MFAKANFHKHATKLAAYLVKGHPHERAELVEMRGFAATDLRDAFRDIEIMARDGTKAKSAFFHCYVRLPKGESLTQEQWIGTVADRIERRLGFTGQARAIAYHTDRQTGERHMHMAWSRIAQTADGKLFALDPGLYFNKLKEISRELEIELGLTRVSNERKPDDRARAADRNEFEEGRRLGTDLKTIRTVILDCFEKSDSGRAFMAALADQGLMLANGDRRDCFVVVDQAGGHHALNKKLTGMTLAATRARLADLDRSNLPGVDQAKQLQAERRAAREAQERQKHRRGADVPAAETTRSDGPARGAQPQIKPLGKTAGEIRLAWRLTTTATQFAQEIEKRGLLLVDISRNEAQASYRAREFAKAIGRQNRTVREGFAVVDRRGNVTRIDQRTTGDQWEEIQKRLGGIDRSELMSVTEARARMAEANRAEFKAKKDAERAQQRINAPVGKTAGAIRMAWAQSRNAKDPTLDVKQLHEALAARGMRMARVDAAEAYESERVSAFAKEVGNRAPVFKEGQLVVVNGFGDIYRLDERTTGQFREAIEERLAGIDAGGLRNIADTKTALQEASRAAWTEQRRLEREKGRPASWAERRIAECANDAKRLGASVVRDASGSSMSAAEALADRLKADDEHVGKLSTVYGTEAFAARLAEAGIAVVRVTAADAQALDALRHDEELARTVAAANSEARPSHHFAVLEEGDFAAVTRNGDVYRVNLGKTGDARQMLAEAALPSLTTARAAFAIEREQIDAVWSHRKTETAAAHETFAAEREERAAAANADRETRRSVEDVDQAVHSTTRTTGRLARSAAKFIDMTWGLLFGWAMAPPKLTADQAERKERAAEENAAGWAAEMARRRVEAEYDERHHRQIKQRQEKDLRLAQSLGGNPTAEANLGRDEFDREREKERQRERER
jgi:hypothetical protein